MNDSNVTDQRIRCGHCGNYHATVAEVRVCATNVARTVLTPPITGPQESFLTRLLEERVHPDWATLTGGPDVPDVKALSKVDAGNIINTMTKQPKKPQQGLVIPDSIPDGRYAYKHAGLNKIVFYRVVTWRDGTSRRVQKVLGSPGDFRYVNVNGTEAQNAIAAIEPDPGFASQLFGHAVGACGVCGSPLTDPESIRLGIGPVCAKKHDW